MYQLFHHWTSYANAVTATGIGAIMASDRPYRIVPPFHWSCLHGETPANKRCKNRGFTYPYFDGVKSHRRVNFVIS